MRLQAVVAQHTVGGTGTDGYLVGTAVTDSDGGWRVVGPSWPSAADRPLVNPDGTITLQAEATSADGSWDRVFDFDVRAPTVPGDAVTVPNPDDFDELRGLPGGPVAGIDLGFAGATPVEAPTPNPLTPVETDYADESAYDVADADEGDETGANDGKRPKKTCDLKHHVCYLTGDPGACRSGEPVSAWRDQKGDSHTQQRWVPVQPIWTTKNGHEHYVLKNGRTTKTSIAYGGRLGNYKGGLTLSTEDSAKAGNDDRVGTWFVGYFRQQWIFRKQRQWCVGADPGHVDYNLMRDSGERRFVPEQWLGGLDHYSATLSPWACHDAYAIKVAKGQTPWVARSSKTTFSGYFSLFGVALDASTENNSEHKLELSSEDTSKFCPDKATSIYNADRVQEE
ncbi:MAG: hypothetical protein QM747_19145 [Nocardioides sp.]